MTTQGNSSSHSGNGEQSAIARPSPGLILRQAHGAKSRAAVCLHVAARTLQARIQELGLETAIKKLKSEIRTGEAEAVLTALHRANGSFSRAASMLNINVKQLRYRIAALELTDDVRYCREELARTRTEPEKRRILSAFKQANCNLTVAARLLRMKYARMYKRILTLDLAGEIAQLRMAKNEQIVRTLVSVVRVGEDLLSLLEPDTSNHIQVV